MTSSVRRLREELFDESSARIFAESNRYSAISEHLMSSQLGFFAGVIPHNPKRRDHNLNVLTEGNQFACHQGVETHVALFPWMVKAVTIESVSLEKNLQFLIKFLRNLVDVFLIGQKPACHAVANGED